MGGRKRFLLQSVVGDRNKWSIRVSTEASLDIRTPVQIVFGHADDHNHSFPSAAEARLALFFVSAECAPLASLICLDRGIVFSCTQAIHARAISNETPRVENSSFSDLLLVTGTKGLSE